MIKYTKIKMIMESNNKKEATFIEWMLSMTFINNVSINIQKIRIFLISKKKYNESGEYVIISDKPYDKSKIKTLKIDRRLSLSGEKNLIKNYLKIYFLLKNYCIYVFIF